MNIEGAYLLQVKFLPPSQAPFHFLGGGPKPSIFKAFRLWPNSTVDHTNNRIALNRGTSIEFLTEPHKVPRSCCLKLQFSARKDRDHSLHI